MIGYGGMLMESFVAIVMIFASIGIIRRALASPTPTVNEAEAIYTEQPMTANEFKGH